jgi:hypothetical protein
VHSFSEETTRFKTCLFTSSEILYIVVLASGVLSKPAHELRCCLAAQVTTVSLPNKQFMAKSHAGVVEFTIACSAGCSCSCCGLSSASL